MNSIKYGHKFHPHHPMIDGRDVVLAEDFDAALEREATLGNKLYFAERELDRRIELSDALQQRLTGSAELLEVWRTWLGPNRESCDEGGKQIWDRIDALKPAGGDGNDA